MSDDGMFTRYYTTTTFEPDAERVRDGCGHLHPGAADAVACSIQRGDIPVVVDRAGKCILPDDEALVTAFGDAIRAGKGGVAGRLAVRASGSDLSGGGVLCHVPR